MYSQALLGVRRCLGVKEHLPYSDHAFLTASKRHVSNRLCVTVPELALQSAVATLH